jgi:hypothetical protein
MAVENGESEKCATRMVQPDERRVGDDVERLLATILGVGTPADVGEETCSMAQPLFLGTFLDPG